MMENFDLVINGENMRLGRLASYVAKELLQGKKIAVIKAEKIVITGNKRWILEEYSRRRERKNIANPRKGSFFYRSPDQIFKRAVRGMLPWKKYKGRKAFSNLRVYVGCPRELQGEKHVRIEDAHAKYLS